MKITSHATHYTRRSLELRPGQEVDDEIARQEKLKRMRAAGILTTDPEEEEEDSDKEEDGSDSEDSETDSDEDAEADAESKASPQKGSKAEAEEDENSMLDNDWDTSEWSMQEIESACGTLITECEKRASKKRQELR